MEKLASSLSKKIPIICMSFVFIISWIFLVKLGLKYLLSYNDFFGYTYTAIGTFFFACIFAPLWEELVFRHAPLQIGKELKIKKDIDVILPIAFITSCIFGWGHGNSAMGVLVQGVCGLALSFTYIKTGYSYWSSVFLHFLWNFSLFYIFPSFCETVGIII